MSLHLYVCSKPLVVGSSVLAIICNIVNCIVCFSEIMWHFLYSFHVVKLGNDSVVKLRDSFVQILIILIVTAFYHF